MVLLSMFWKISHSCSNLVDMSSGDRRRTIIVARVSSCRWWWWRRDGDGDGDGDDDGLAHQRTDYAKKRDIILSLNDADPIACRQGVN